MQTFGATLLQDDDVVATGLQVAVRVSEVLPFRTWHGTIMGVSEAIPFPPGGYTLRADDGREGCIVIRKRSYTPDELVDFTGSGPFE